MHVKRLSERIDDFDGDAERLAWALRAVLALAQAGPAGGWRGDMRHLPFVGHLPTSPFVTRYLVVKQHNNGDTFLITQADPADLLGSRSPPTPTSLSPTGWWAGPPTRSLSSGE